MKTMTKAAERFMDITGTDERARRMLKIGTRLAVDAFTPDQTGATKVQRGPLHFLRHGWLMDHE
jgi:hypothetical protein